MKHLSDVTWTTEALMIIVKIQNLAEGHIYSLMELYDDIAFRLNFYVDLAK